MLRPSRPMIRPLRSSDGSWTTDTVVSAVWLLAVRWMATERMFRARRSASWRVSSSISRTTRDIATRLCSSTLASRVSRAWVDDIPAIRS